MHNYACAHAYMLSVHAYSYVQACGCMQLYKCYVCMCVQCVYSSMCVYMGTGVCVCAQVCVCIHVCISIHVCAAAQVLGMQCMCAYMYVCKHASVCSCTSAVYAGVCRRVHIHVHRCACMCTSMCMHACVNGVWDKANSRSLGTLCIMFVRFFLQVLNYAK